MKTGKQKRKINKTKGWFFDNINKSIFSFHQTDQEKKIQVMNIRSDRQAIIIVYRQ